MRGLQIWRVKEETSKCRGLICLCVVVGDVKVKDLCRGGDNINGYKTGLHIKSYTVHTHHIIPLPGRKKRVYGLKRRLNLLSNEHYHHNNLQ